MTIKRFRVVGVSHKPEHKAARYALSTLIPAGAVEGTDAAVQAAMAQLFDRRRRRLIDLQQADHEPFQAGLLYTYMMNCPPVGVLTNRLAMIPCDRVPLCPYCWCRRYVGKTMQRYRQYLFPVGAEHPRVELRESATNWTLSQDRWPSAADVLMEAKDHRRSLPRLSKKAIGMSAVTGVEPTEDGWRICHRVLQIVPEKPRYFEYEKPAMSGSKGARGKSTIRRTRLWYGTDEEPPGSPAWILNAAIGRLARYPSGLLTGDLARTRELLEFMQIRRLRFCDHYGVLRGPIREELPETQVSDDDVGRDEELSRENY